MSAAEPVVLDGESAGAGAGGTGRPNQATPEDKKACVPYVVVEQHVEIEVNFREKSISGVSTMVIFPITSTLDEIYVDARQCEIDVANVTVGGQKVKATYVDPLSLMDVPRQWSLGALQHHVLKNCMRPLLPNRRPDVPIQEREALVKEEKGCIPCDRSLRVSLKPEKEPEPPSIELDENSQAGQSRPQPVRKLTIKREPSRAVKPEPSDAPLDLQDGTKTLKIAIPFRTKHFRDGLQFVGVDAGDSRYPQVYTRHSTEPGTASSIFPCVDDLGHRCNWAISIKCPRTLGDALDQRLATQQIAQPAPENNRKRKRERPAPEPVPAPAPYESGLTEEDKLLEMTVVCSGNLVGEKTDPNDERKKVMTFECSNTAVQHIGFAVAPFEHVELWSEFRTEEFDEKLGGLATKVHAYCLPGRADDVRSTCSPVVMAADYFSLEFGRFPFESYKMCFLDDMIPDSVALSSLSLCSNRLLYSEDIIDPEIEVTRKLVHALSSQYAGVHIMANQRSDIWLVVAFQWYMADMFMKTICGNNWYKFHLKTRMDKCIEADVGRPSLNDLGQYLHLGEFEMEFMTLKAPLVLFILDQRMVKSAGSFSVTRMISLMVYNANVNDSDPMHTSLCSEAFRIGCEKKSRYRTDIFWKEYVYGAGLPKFAIRQKFNKKNLNVDIIVQQVHSVSKDAKRGHLVKEDFWKEYEEEVYNVYAGDVPRCFVGPYTVRIHEADGTPYEHYMDIYEDLARERKDGGPRSCIFQIPYNTKYKRLKRKGRSTKDNTAANWADKQGAEGEDDVVYFNMMGDVLQSDEEKNGWGLIDFNERVIEDMNSQSYEWIRFDCNAEWICETRTDMPNYMYLAQLQQDRDVAAHQEGMLYFQRARASAEIATIETRTAIDRRYYYGVRTMAIDDLWRHALAELGTIGMYHLMLLYREWFCNSVASKGGATSYTPAPNDFSDRAQYAMQLAIPRSLAKVRVDGRCPKQARDFLLELLRFNDNTNNDFSDQFHIANLLDSLAGSLLTEPKPNQPEVIFSLKEYVEADMEYKGFIEKVLEELDRYRRMDEWTGSYQNIWTTTALESKKRLMKSRVIPIAPLEFVRYLQDENIDLVRIKAFECLVDLGLLSRAPIMRLLLSVLSTDKSPYVRDRLFKIFSRGIGAMALGEFSKALERPPPAQEDVDESGLIVEGGDAITDARRALEERKTDINSAIKALKEDLMDNKEMQLAMWKAITSRTIGLQEKRNLLDLCSAMFVEDNSLLITLEYPRAWEVSIGPHVPKRFMVSFTSHFRTAPRNYVAKPEVVAQAVAEAPPAPAVELEAAAPPTPVPAAPVNKKIRLSSKPSFSGPSSSSVVIPTTPGAAASTPAQTPTPSDARRPSITAEPPRPRPTGDSISVMPKARAGTPIITAKSSASPAPVPAAVQQVNGATVAAKAKSDSPRPKLPKKRKSDEAESPAAVDRPKKVQKTQPGASAGSSGANGKARRIVTVSFRRWTDLSDATLRAIRSGAANSNAAKEELSIVATPVSKRTSLPTGPSASASQAAASARESTTDIYAFSSSPTVAGSSPEATPSQGPPAKAARKPLPSGPSHVSSSPATTNGNGLSNGGGSNSITANGGGGGGSSASAAASSNGSGGASVQAAAAAPPKKLIIKLSTKKLSFGGAGAGGSGASS